MKLTIKQALALAVAANPHRWRGSTMQSEFSIKEIGLMERAHIAVRTLKSGNVKVSVHLSCSDIGGQFIDGCDDCKRMKKKGARRA